MKPSTYVENERYPVLTSPVPLCPVCKQELQPPMVCAIEECCGERVVIEPLEREFRSFVILF